MILSLRLKQGNDEAIKKHLATKLKEHKEVIENLKNNVFNLEDTVAKKNLEILE